MRWPIRSVVAGTAGTAALTIAYAAERRLRPRVRGPLDYDDSLVPGEIVATVMHLPHVTARGDRDLGLALRWSYGSAFGLLHGTLRRLVGEPWASVIFGCTLMTATFRRPVTPDVPLDADFPKALIVELTFPSDIGVVDRILDSYLSEQRRPAHSYFLLDVSGSMEGARLSQLETALRTLVGGDSSLTGRFARFQPRERVSLATFSNAIIDRQEFDMGTAAQAPAVRASIGQYVNGLQAGGPTALFSSLHEVYLSALEARKSGGAAEAGRYFSIVVMTDGQSNAGEKLSDFDRFYRGLPPADRDIKVFPIVFGEADRGQLDAIAQLTGGRVFDGNTAALSAVFKEIRGYQ